ncbi:MAG: anthrone oxygenase family protein [Planctomycetota bacterium]
MIALTVICAVGAAAASGALFTFSDFTMKGLRRLPPAQGIAAMQAINKAAPSPLFMLLLFGTGATCIAMMVLAGQRLDEPGSTLRLVAGGLYVASVVVLTIAYHVPRNDRLDRVDPESAEGAEYWAVYQRQWIPMNHVRSIAPLVSAALLMLSLATRQG